MRNETIDGLSERLINVFQGIAGIDEKQAIQCAIRCVDMIYESHFNIMGYELEERMNYCSRFTLAYRQLEQKLNKY